MLDGFRQNKRMKLDSGEAAAPLVVGGLVAAALTV